MNFFDYIGISQDEFVEKYLQAWYVNEFLHKEFPLNMFFYSRQTVYENAWDSVTSKCRGIIVHRWTGEIVARPFEKFHNYGSETTASSRVEAKPELYRPTIVEKVDGFLVTGYRWDGVWYAASKGSFHSTHAKWATAELKKKTPYVEWPHGYTPVFEGLCRDLRIVIDYGDRQGLVLLALINNETGEEMPPEQLAEEAALRGFSVPQVYSLSLAEAVAATRKDNVLPGEGYVLTWYRKDGPPFRLKLKYTEYFRLSRIVTGVTPKQIFEAVSQPWLAGELDEYLNHSTPWFTKFATKWIKAFRDEFARIKSESEKRYLAAKELVRAQYAQGSIEFEDIRKTFAFEFNKPENKEFASILFQMLDGKDTTAVIWKKVKGLAANSHPLVNTHVA